MSKVPYNSYDLDAKSPEEAFSKIAKIKSADFIDENDRNALCARVLQALEENLDAECNDWTKHNRKRTTELRAKIRQDSKTDKDFPAVGANTVIAVMTEMMDSIQDASNEITASPKEMSERCGLHVNNFYKVRKYLQKIGAIFQGEGGFVDLSSNSEKSKKPAQCILWKIDKWYFNPYYVCKYRSFKAEIKHLLKDIHNSPSLFDQGFGKHLLKPKKAAKNNRSDNWQRPFSQ